MSETPKLSVVPPAPPPDSPEVKLARLQTLLTNGTAELNKTIETTETSILKVEKQLKILTENVISLKAQRNLLKEINEVL